MSKFKKMSPRQQVKLEKLKLAFCKGFGCERRLAEELASRSVVGEFGSKEEFVRLWLETNNEAWRGSDPKMLKKVVDELFGRFYLFVDGFVFFDHWAK